MSCRLVALMAFLLLTRPGSAVAQSDASLGLGLGTIRFPGGSTLGVISLVPSVQVIGPNLAMDLGGTLASLPSGNGYAQGRLSTWVSSAPLVGRWRVALEGRLSGATSGAATASGAGQLSVEGLWAAPRWGLAFAAGPAAGWIANDSNDVTAWRGRVRGWWQSLSGRLQLTGIAEPTRFLNAWFTDAGASVVARSRRFEAGIGASARVSRRYGSKAAALASIELRVSPRVTLEGAAGNVLPDPYQALPASGFVMVGVRLHFSPRASRPDVVVRSRTFSAFRRGDGVLVRIRLRDAQLVTIAGDWNGWTPAPLERTDGDVWESAFPLTPGLHQFVVFVDGAAWQIPEGVPSVPDGMGGRIAVLTVF
jgi:hypothetical protein